MIELLSISSTLAEPSSECQAVNVRHGSSSSEPVLVLDINTPVWVLSATRQLDEMARLQCGWDSYGGLPLRMPVRQHAMQFLGWLSMDQLPTPNLVLGSAGTLQFEWRDKGRELDIELRGNGAAGFLKVAPGGNVDEGEIEQDSRDQMRKLARWILND